MTQEERFIARLKSLDESSLYEIVVYITAEKTIGFWIVKKQPIKLEGELRVQSILVELPQVVVK